MIGLLIVAGTGLLYLALARPDRHSDAVPEGDAREMAQHLQQIAHLQQIRQQSGALIGKAPAVPTEENR